MKERPIIFSAPMVKAILDGRKTQTRRALNPQPSSGIQIHPFAPHGVLNGEGSRLICRFGQKGDRLWVRESTHEEWLPYNGSSCCFSVYSADNKVFSHGWDYSRKKRPSIHMPRWASRITLEITNIRVEHLQDISDEDCLAEGISGPYDVGYQAYKLPDDSKPRYSRAQAAYESLWGSINGAESWGENPWVWVIEFKRVC